MIIREATPADAAGIAHVHVESWQTTYRGIVADDFLAALSVEKREQNWVKWLSDPNRKNVVYVAEDRSGKIVGFVSGGPEQSGDSLYTGEIYAIYLLQSQQQKGVGRKLVQSVAWRLVQNGLHSVLVWVLADNPSRSFYEKLGGKLAKEKTVAIGKDMLFEVAYGWENAAVLLLEWTGEQVGEASV